MVLNGRVLELEEDEVGLVKQVGPLVGLEKTPGRVVVGSRGSASTPRRSKPSWRSGRRSTAGHLQSAPWGTPGQRTASSTPEASAAGRVAAGPLAGVTIVEVAYFLAGPLGSTLLAEMGARVIKVEPIEGDPFRRVGLEFAHLQHGKESVALDLKSEQGRSVLHALVKKADVFFHNFRPGAMERLGCDYASIRDVNPAMVYVNASSYGSAGPEANRAAFHSTPNALSGGGILQAGDDNPPVDDSYADPCAGIAVASAIMIGLAVARRFGIGQYLETTMLCSAGFVHSNNLVAYDGAPARLAVDGGQHGLHALYRLYPCSEGMAFPGRAQRCGLASLRSNGRSPGMVGGRPVCCRRPGGAVRMPNWQSSSAPPLRAGPRMNGNPS